MISRTAIAALAACASVFVGLVLVSSVPATAQPARVQPQDCRALAAGHQGGIWQTVFRGWKRDAFGYRQELFASPCFTTEKDCKAWLYWARSDFDPYYAPPKLCHRVQ